MQLPHWAELSMHLRVQLNKPFGIFRDSCSSVDMSNYVSFLFHASETKYCTYIPENITQTTQRIGFLFQFNIKINQIKYIGMYEIKQNTHTRQLSERASCQIKKCITKITHKHTHRERDRKRERVNRNRSLNNQLHRTCPHNYT